MSAVFPPPVAVESIADRGSTSIFLSVGLLFAGVMLGSVGHASLLVAAGGVFVGLTALWLVRSAYESAPAERGMAYDLMHAAARGELSLAFQPIVEAADERIVGFEALLRWSHPRFGDIPPAVFIPVAEAGGQIIEIGAWVIEQACRHAAHWPAEIRVAVNLSAVQFGDPALVRVVGDALAASGIAADRLELEITESILLGAGTGAMIARLKRLGVRLALDDFGTGYSSLGYLREAAFGRIKIDRSFVQCAAAAETRSTAIIEAIVGLADALGIAITAEGAETRAEFELCRALGCGQVQGYLFGRPMAADAATALVSRG